MLQKKMNPVNQNISLKYFFIFGSVGSQLQHTQSFFTAHGPSQLWREDLVALWHVGSSRTRDGTHVPCIDRWILNPWITREVPIRTFLKVHSIKYFPKFFRQLLTHSNNGMLICQNKILQPGNLSQNLCRLLSSPKYLVFGHRRPESQQMHLPVNSTMVFCIISWLEIQSCVLKVLQRQRRK